MIIAVMNAIYAIAYRSLEKSGPQRGLNRRFIAQLVRASHRYREVTGSNPVEVLTFSDFYTQ